MCIISLDRGNPRLLFDALFGIVAFINLEMEFDYITKSSVKEQLEFHIIMTDIGMQKKNNRYANGL